MRLLVITETPAITEFARKILVGRDVIIAESKHAATVEAIGSFQPTHVIIGEYEFEANFKPCSDFSAGWNTYALITSKFPELRRLRTGFIDHQYPDFLRLPFIAEELVDKLFNHPEKESV